MSSEILESLHLCGCVCVTETPGLQSHVPVRIRILDVNDNPPELAEDYDVVVCENAKPNQVTC